MPGPSAVRPAPVTATANAAAITRRRSGRRNAFMGLPSGRSTAPQCTVHRCFRGGPGFRTAGSPERGTLRANVGDRTHPPPRAHRTSSEQVRRDGERGDMRRLLIIVGLAVALLAVGGVALRPRSGPAGAGPRPAAVEAGAADAASTVDGVARSIDA